MEAKTKTCQNCKKKFVIEKEDFEFYEKIQVPEPTFCPECRVQRRFAFGNFFELYKRKCDFSGEDIITIYKPETKHKVFHSKYWWSDEWDPLDYGKEIDWSRPFLEQIRELIQEVPRPHNLNVGSVNCDYCAWTYNSKNCYMASCNACEDCFYTRATQSRDCFDCLFATNCENCTNSILCDNCFDVHFSEYCNDCVDSAFLYGCRNCQSCFGCVNLKNKKYHIFNKKYSQEDYQKEIKKYDLGDYAKLEEARKEFEEFKLRYPRRFALIYHSQNITGDCVYGSKNCRECFFVLGGASGAEDCKFICNCNDLKDCMDCYDTGAKAELCYECSTAGANSNKIFFSVNVGKDAFNVEYSQECFSSSNLFGCVSLRHNSYCILNKQYSEKEYFKLVEKIKKHMDEVPYRDKKGNVYKYGEFFPSEFSLHDYNKSMAQENFFLSKEEVIENGYSWYDPPSSEAEPTMDASEIPNNIKDVEEKITEEVIKCSNPNCQGRGVYKIVPKELEYHKKHGLSLQRTCFYCRYWDRARRKPLVKLYKRRCMCHGKKDQTGTYTNQNPNHRCHKPDQQCPNTFQTTYAPDSKEIVYCEECYQREVE